MKPLELDTMSSNMKQATNLLKALGNERRLMILCQLRTGEKSVGQLEAIIGLSQSALSQHLARLRRDHYVATRREAQTVFYRLSGDAPSRVIDVLYELYCGRRPDRGEQTTDPKNEEEQTQ